MNADLEQLQPYPFEKLNALLAGLVPPADKPLISLSIGEPKHASPDFVKTAICEQLSHLATYPTTKGLADFRQAIAQWLMTRFALKTVDPETQVLPVSGTREAIFSFVQAAINPVNTTGQKPIVIMPNPFYQIYEGAALLAGAEPYFVNCTAENDYLGDWDSIPEAIWQRAQLIFICTPGNPTGAVLPEATLRFLINQAQRYQCILASDECYSELYYHEQAPLGLLQVAARMGSDDYRHCVVFHSLSKRSNLPGLRSGFIAGDAQLLAPYLKYRTYHGAAMPVQHQIASALAWRDEAHVIANRAAYQAKFDQFTQTLGSSYPLTYPAGGFYFWMRVQDDEAFAQALFEQQHIIVLPGRYLSRSAHGINPGAQHVRMALVADASQCRMAIDRLAVFATQRPELLGATS